MNVQTVQSYILVEGSQYAALFEHAGYRSLESNDVESIISLSHYSKNALRTYYERRMSKFMVKSAGTFILPQIMEHNMTDTRT